MSASSEAPVSQRLIVRVRVGFLVLNPKTYIPFTLSPKP